ncbi:N-acetylneuraminate synthase [Idiomarina zobellii]|uniref:Polyhydroxyalkanoate biosynthesis repressor PhaR n=1 Tax=Idiomarina zobellii TaxID=86103 RepID=A0A837ND58_9GAMM|nr:N-acetylneuraminate synthase [Idiomarina zobellii]KPD21775.1 polyhydroxyalkanoate biosynthesis repressor PhaR [Idiomarina zobellii]SDG25865.1 N-acetylneuraminate synthase [Idiomarina zobellii]
MANPPKKHPVIKIGSREIGYDHDPVVVAEIGINHEGSLETAYEMVDAAVSAGAEIIKHQTHVVEDEMSADAKKVIPGNADVSIYEIMERCALNEEDETKLKEYVESKGAIFISTPFSRAAAERLERMGVEAYKIGSGECNNYPLLELVASYKKPIILSTGMNDIPSIAKAVDIFRKHGVQYALLHCTNVYPTPDHLIRLGAMNQLQDAFDDAVVGLSDHSIDNLACLGAVAVGASILERHFTDHKQRTGPDINCSMDTEECRTLIQESKRMKAMRGGQKGAVAEEQVTIDFAYASVVTIKPIKQGETFSQDNLWVKRPGTGQFLADDYEKLMGKTAARDIENDVQLRSEDVQ